MNQSGRPGDPSWWRGRVAIITGASSGIGRATAEALLRRGGRAALIARSAEQLAALAAPWGEDALPLPADVRDQVALDAQIGVAVERWGRVDALVCAAGLSGLQLAEHFDDQLRIIVETNLLGAAWATRAVLPAMRRAGFGRIVYVGSVLSYVATVGFAGYAASKWGLRALAQSLRAELRGSGIGVSLVAPYYVRTPLLDVELEAGPLPGYDARRVLEPADVATAIIRAAERGQREVILAPRSLRMGLFLGSLLPGLQELVLARGGRALAKSLEKRGRREERGERRRESGRDD